MRTPEISVIIPVYNSGKWISRCIESVLSQTFEDFELILVDDGSTDDSAEICSGYSAEDGRIILIRKENGGVGSARNLGLSKCRGRYVTFIDSDDWVDERYLEVLYEGHQSDVSSCLLELVGSDEKWLVNDNWCDEEIDLIENNERIIVYGDILGYVIAKLFNTSKIKENRIVFPEDIMDAEDLVFMLRYLEYSRSFRIAASRSYMYNRGNTDSLTHRKDVDLNICLAKIDYLYTEILKLQDIFGGDYRKLLINYCGDNYYALLKHCGSIKQMSQLMKRESVRYVGRIKPLRLGRAIKLFSMMNRLGATRIGIVLLHMFRGKW